MDLAHGNSSAVAIGNAGTRRAGLTKFVAGIVTGVAVTALLATAVIALPRGNVGPTTQGDPFGGQAAVEFRAGERGLTVSQPDPFGGQAAVEFRAGERQGATK